MYGNFNEYSIFQIFPFVVFHTETSMLYSGRALIVLTAAKALIRGCLIKSDSEIDGEYRWFVISQLILFTAYYAHENNDTFAWAIPSTAPSKKRTKL